MKLENQVVSLELAKRLKELGIRQESAFYWTWMKGESGLNLGQCPSSAFESPQEELDIRYYLAFTVAELGEILKEHELECIWFPEHNKWGAFQTNSGIDTLYADTEADARARMLIYLIENELISQK